MDSDFFTGYRTTTMKPNEILKSVIIPLTKKVIYCNVKILRLPYESICWRGINVGGLAVER